RSTAGSSRLPSRAPAVPPALSLRFSGGDSMKGLRRSALAAEEMQRIAPRPGVGRIADGAERLVLRERTLAGVAGDGMPHHVHILFTTDRLAPRTTPTHCHFARKCS